MPTTNKPSQDLATYVEFARLKGGMFPSLTFSGEVVRSKSSGRRKDQLKTLKLKIFIKIYKAEIHDFPSSLKIHPRNVLYNSLPNAKLQNQ